MTIINTIKRLVLHGNAYINTKQLKEHQFLDELGIDRRYFVNMLNNESAKLGASKIPMVQGYIYEATREQREILKEMYLEQVHYENLKPLKVSANVDDILYFRREGEVHHILLTTKYMASPLVLENVSEIELRRCVEDCVYYTKVHENKRNAEGRLREIHITVERFKPLQGTTSNNQY